MPINIYFPMTLIAVALVSGCSTLPQNSALSQAQATYDSARSNPQVVSLAPVQLKDAGDSLNQANQALSKGDSEATVTHLAYIAQRKAEIAQEIAKGKADESIVTNSSAKLAQMQLEANAAEIAKAKQKIATAQETADQQAAALAAANTKAEKDQALISQQQAKLEALNAKKTARGMVITLGNVLFSTDKARLASGGVRNVEKLGEFLQQYPKYNVLVEGYTDSTGSDALNQALSKRRADAVRAVLLDMGISSDRVTARGYGKEFPVATNKTAAGRQLNRRVEIVLSGENGNLPPR
ncbi:MAG: OmpA family protein [Sulfuriferula sp.]